MSAALTWLIAIVVFANILGCLWLMFATAKRHSGEVGEGEVKPHVWDEDLRELNNPMPRWWLHLFILSIVFGVGYLLVYPGLTVTQGQAQWSSAGELEARLSEIHARRDQVFATFREQPIPALATHADARRLGAAIYGNACAGCHGAQAQGAVGYPNLTDDDWLYGGEPETIVYSVREGRQSQMPAFNAQLSPTELEALLELLETWPRAIAANTSPPEAGLRVYQQRCAACHGATGDGNTALGSPRLNDDIWLHGSSRAAMRHTILFGRQAQMPPHAELLSEDEIRLVSAYVYGLSRQE